MTLGPSRRAHSVEVVELRDLSEVVEASAVLAAVWDLPPRESPVAHELLRAFAHTGCYVAGARLDGALVGVAVAFPAGQDGGELHSHVTGVLAPFRGRHVGLALKLHQRSWAAERGYGTITWTFDPLVRRNARFNLHRLKAVGVEYHADFYGPLDTGDEGDRLLASWPVRPPALVDERGARDAVVVLGESDGEPEASAPPADSQAARLVQVPHDIGALRRDDPARARRWRLAVRSAMVGALAAGLVATDVVDDGVLFTPAP